MTPAEIEPASLTTVPPHSPCIYIKCFMYKVQTSLWRWRFIITT